MSAIVWLSGFSVDGRTVLLMTSPLCWMNDINNIKNSFQKSFICKFYIKLNDICLA
jgi:hypothetical protein